MLIDPSGIRLSQQLSTLFILGLIGGALVLLLVLYLRGWLDKLLQQISHLLNFGIHLGFRFWERTLFWARWPGYLILTLLLFGFGVEALAFGQPWLGLLCAVALLATGVSSCLAFIFVSLERSEVSRGYKAIHNPAKGQNLARNVLNYGERLGPKMLAISAVVTILAFALLNHAIYEAVNPDWYIIRDPEAVPTYLDFLAFTLIHLSRMVDILDLMSSSQSISMSFVRQGAWPVNVILVTFKSFFMMVLLQQVFAALREQRLFGEMVADFWNPHAPIHERARTTLVQAGPQAVTPVLRALPADEVLTKEQRDELPKTLAELGPFAIPELVKHLQDAHPTIRGVVVMALGHLQASAATVSLANLYGDPNTSVRSAVALALGLIGRHLGVAPRNNSKRRLVRLKTWLALGRRGSRVVLRVCLNLGYKALGLPRWFKFERDTVPLVACVQALRILLSDSEAEVRGQAAKSLGRIGSLAEAATDDLLAALLHEEQEPPANGSEFTRKRSEG